MNKNVLKSAAFALMISLGFTSCKDKENDMAEQRIAALESYVDSLKTVSAEDMEANWDQIAADFDRKSAEANEAIATMDEANREKSQTRVTTSVTKYDEFKMTIDAKKNAPEASSAAMTPSQALRDRLFGAGKIGDDMNFSWVNKDNILKVYDTFYQSYKENKESFTREDYDEIKLMWEALDARKNTVEKEGLSSEDNNKIASIKMKWSPMFKVNRVGAKSRENSDAKE